MLFDIHCDIISNMKNIKYKIIYLLLFCFIILFPVFAKVVGLRNDLFGVEYEAKLKDVNIQNLMDFSFQDSLDDFITQKLPGKAQLARIRNEILYRLFKVSSNFSLNITDKDDIVFDETMDYYNHGLHYVDDEYVDSFVTKLNELNNILKSKNADLVLYITPTKSRYVSNDDLLVDRFMSKHSSFDKVSHELPYNKLINRLKSTDIKIFDSVDYIEKNNRSFFDENVPLYYDTSHHWSIAVGNKVGIDFLDYVSNNTKVKFSKLTQSISEIDSPIFPDNDILELCNVISKPQHSYYSSDIQISDLSHTKSNIIIRGGSYLGQVPFIQAMLDDDSNVLLMSNTDVFTDNWQTTQSINEYDQIDFKKYTKDIDLIILEINEVNVYNATFGFLDYLLDNKDKLFY